MPSAIRLLHEHILHGLKLLQQKSKFLGYTWGYGRIVHHDYHGSYTKSRKM